MAKSKTKFDWWAYVKNMLISLLKQKAVKLLLGKIVSIALIPGGVQAWLASFIVEQLFDRLIIPILKELELEGRYRIDVINGKKKVKLLDKAIENHDENSFDDIVDSL